MLAAYVKAWDLWGSGLSSLFFSASLHFLHSFFVFFFPTPPSPASCSSKCLLNSSPGTRWLWGFCSQRFKFRRTRVWEEHEEHCSQVQPRRNESQFPACFFRRRLYFWVLGFRTIPTSIYLFQDGAMIIPLEKFPTTSPSEKFWLKN